MSQTSNQQQQSTTSTKTPLSPCEAFLKNLTGNWKGDGTVFGFSLGDKVIKYDVEMNATRPMGGKTVQKFVESRLESRHAEKKVGMHFESGFWRCSPTKDDEISWMISHNSGNVEAVEGTVTKNGKSAMLESVVVAGAPETQKTQRVFSFEGAESGGGSSMTMKYLFSMQTLSFPKMTPHLAMTFKRMEE